MLITWLRPLTRVSRRKGYRLSIFRCPSPIWLIWFYEYDLRK